MQVKVIGTKATSFDGKEGVKVKGVILHCVKARSDVDGLACMDKTLFVSDKKFKEYEIQPEVWYEIDFDEKGRIISMASE